MNDIDEFLEVTAALFLAITVLLICLTYLETSLHADRHRKPRRPVANENEPGTSSSDQPNLDDG